MMIENKKKTPTFHKWMMLFTDKNNEIGFLSRFVIKDKCFPKLYNKTIVYHHLKRHCMVNKKFFEELYMQYEEYVFEFNKKHVNNEKCRTAGKKMRHLILKKYDYRCVECGATNKNSLLQIDHIKPWSKGGKTILDNLQVLCQICNNNKFTDEWVGGENE